MDMHEWNVPTAGGGRRHRRRKPGSGVTPGARTPVDDRFAHSTYSTVMKTESYRPCTALEPSIQTILVQESDSCELKRVFPITSVVMSFRIRGARAFVDGGGREVLPFSSVSGLRKGARPIARRGQGAGPVSVLRRAPCRYTNELSILSFCRQS